MCGPQWIGFCAEMFKRFVCNSARERPGPKQNSIPEGVSGKPGKRAHFILNL